MGSIFGKYLRAATFGESHGPAVGVVVEGAPAGMELPVERIQHELDRRRPGSSPFVSARKESDQVEILSGVANGKTLGSPIALLVRNQDARSKDYRETVELFRPDTRTTPISRNTACLPSPGEDAPQGARPWAGWPPGRWPRRFWSPWA